MESLKGSSLSYAFTMLIMVGWAVPLVQGQISSESSISPTLTMMTASSSVATAVTTSNEVAHSSQVPQSTPSPTPLSTPSPMLDPEECNGEYSYSSAVPQDSLFEVVLNNTSQLNETEVDMFVMSLAVLLGEFCENNTCTPSMYSINDTFMENLTRIYFCSKGTTHLILGLVYIYDSEVISTMSVLTAFQSAESTLFGYGFFARKSTQNRTVVMMTTTPTNSISTTDAMPTSNTGLMTNQIVGIAVGAAAAFILVIVTVVVLASVCVISSKKSAKVATVTTVKTKRAAGDTPILVSHGNKNKNMLAVSDL